MELEPANFIGKVFEEFRKIPTNQIKLTKSKKKKNPLPNRVEVKILDSFNKFPTTLGIIIVDESPYFHCRFCQTSLCYHIVFLLFHILKIKSLNMIALYYFWRPEFIQKLILYCQGIHLELNHEKNYQEYLAILAEIDHCPVCQEDLDEKKKMKLFQCEKCLKPIHVKCWNSWVNRHKKEEQKKLKCLHCHK